MQKQTVRNSNFEILRIVAMVMIVAHHFAVHSGFNTAQMPYYNALWITLLQNGGKIGVNLFVLISGYFLVGKKDFKFASILKLYTKAAIYAVVLFLIGKFALGSGESGNNLFNVFEPINSSTWWFLTFYYALFLTYPFINKLIYSINKQTHKNLLIIMGIMLIIPYIIFGNTPIYSSAIWFLFLYILAAYIRIYDLKTKLNQYQLILVYLAVYISLSIISNAITHLPNNNNYFVFFVKNISDIHITNNFFNLALSVCLFMAFKQMKPTYNKFINTIANCMLGVYLIHDAKFIRSWLWQGLCKNQVFQNSPYLIVHSLYVIPLVFVACVGIDLIYNFTLGRLINKFINWLNKKCLYKIDKLFVIGDANTILKNQTSNNQQPLSSNQTTEQTQTNIDKNSEIHQEDLDKK